MAGDIRLLFVDDEQDFVDFMVLRLRKQGFDVSAFTDPLKALEETEGKTFDVGLLDLKMPGMDGEELLRRLKERTPRMEIIILTGHGGIESAFRTGQLKAYEYLLKPCDYGELTAAINRAFARRIKAVQELKAERVDDLMKRAMYFSPQSLLEELRKLDAEE